MFSFARNHETWCDILVVTISYNTCGNTSTYNNNNDEPQCRRRRRRKTLSSPFKSHFISNGGFIEGICTWINGSKFNESSDIAKVIILLAELCSTLLVSIGTHNFFGVNVVIFVLFLILCKRFLCSRESECVWAFENRHSLVYSITPPWKMCWLHNHIDLVSAWRRVCPIHDDRFWLIVRLGRAGVYWVVWCDYRYIKAKHLNWMNG